jgi:hypothetical protein
MFPEFACVTCVVIPDSALARDPEMQAILAWIPAWRRDVVCGTNV